VKKMLSQTEEEIIPVAWKNDLVFLEKFRREIQNQQCTSIAVSYTSNEHKQPTSWKSNKCPVIANDGRKKKLFVSSVGQC
jgi:hypothetical protein